MCDQKAVRRLTATEKKRSWTDALRPELMSSEDDDDSEKEDVALVVKALPCRRDELNQFIKH